MNWEKEIYPRIKDLSDDDQKEAILDIKDAKENMEEIDLIIAAYTPIIKREHISLAANPSKL